MINLIPTLLPRLEANRLPGLDAGARLVYPAYDGYALSNLPAGICRWLGVPPLGQPPGVEILSALPGPFQHVVLMVVDGLGLKLFEQLVQPEREGQAAMPAWSRLLGDALLVPLTSVSPSTTAAALTSLWSGTPPATHGVIGYELWLKEYGVVANMLFQSAASFGADTGGLRRAGFQPENFLQVPTLGGHLLAHGVQAYALQHASIARSGLSTMHMPQVNVIPYRTQADLWVTLGGLLEGGAAERSYTYVYWGDIDELSHKFGPEDERVVLEFASFSMLLERFISRMRARKRGNTLFLMVADHGLMFTPRNTQFELKNHPQLVSMLAMQPTGESRLSYLFPRVGREEQLAAYIEQAWPGCFRLLPAEVVVRAGLLGNGAAAHPRFADRLGDYVLVAQGSSFWWWPERENVLLGRHGGLSAAEMLVPLVGFVL